MHGHLLWRATRGPAPSKPLPDTLHEPLRGLGWPAAHDRMMPAQHKQGNSWSGHSCTRLLKYSWAATTSPVWPIPGCLSCHRCLWRLWLERWLGRWCRLSLQALLLRLLLGSPGLGPGRQLALRKAPCGLLQPGIAPQRSQRLERTGHAPHLPLQLLLQCLPPVGLRLQLGL